MRKKRLLPLAMISLLSCSVCTRAQGPVPSSARNEGDRNLLASDINPAANAPAAHPNYSIGAEDVLTIDVWKEPEMSRTLVVRTDGKISLPLLNDVQAAGLTPEQLGSEIAEKLHKEIVHPQVTVIVAQMNSQRVYILGQVLKGGSYPLLPNMTAVQAVSGAGFTPYAKLKKIRVIRIENKQKQIFPVNFKEVINGRNLDQDIQLKSDDTIVVP